MDPSVRTIFFYGLFMDRAHLEAEGLDPVVVGPAALRGYRLHIGDRATLLPRPASRALGVVMRLTDPEARALYADSSVAEYRPEPVCVELVETGRAVDAECFVLPPERSTPGANPEYARRLAALAGALGFEPDYVAEILAFSGPRGAT